MTLFDAIETDLRNIMVVLDGDRQLREDLRKAAWLGSKPHEEMALLRMQVARFVNETSEKAWRNMNWAE